MTINLAGRQVGELTVLKRVGRNRKGKILWECLCSCGKTYIGITYELNKEIIRTCGCCELHIHHKDAYISWQAAKQRCYNPAQKDYQSYGGRGITMCQEWKDSFRKFLADMGDPPLDTITRERLSLDRKDNNGNYCKENCTWADRSWQQLNKREYKAVS